MYRLLGDAVQIDPAAVVERFETIKFKEPDYLNLGRVQLVEALAKENLDEALAQSEVGPNPETRAFCYLGICEVLQDLEKSRAREILDQSLLNARAITSAEFRIMTFARIADKLIDLGEKDRARKLLVEAEELARSTTKGNKGGFNLGLVGESLARLDLPAALKLVEELAREVRKNDRADRTYVFVKIYGQMAHKLAADSPVDAEQLLERIRKLAPTDASRYIVAACARMASKDPARARKIAETMLDADALELKPYALGLIAHEVAVTDKAGAVRLLESAYEELERFADRGRISTLHGNAVIAGGLLPIVEEIAPARLPEFLARTLSLREPWLDRNSGAYNAQQTAALSMIIARYDRSLAARLLRPHVEQLATLRISGPQDYTSWRILAALAMIDPREAVERIEKLYDDKTVDVNEISSARMWAITFTAKLLAHQGRERWTQVYENFLYLWTPDQRYL